MIFNKLLESDNDMVCIETPVNSGFLINAPIEFASIGKTTIVITDSELTKLLYPQAKRRYKSVGFAINSEISYTLDNKIIYLSHDYYFRQLVAGNEIKCNVLVVNRNLYPISLLWSYYSMKCKLIMVNCPTLSNIKLLFDRDPAAIAQFTID